MKKARKTITIDFEGASRLLPFIKVRFDGIAEDKIALIDSGSELTVLDQTIAESVSDSAHLVRVKAEDINIDGFGGTESHKNPSYFASLVTLTDIEGTEWKVPIDGAVIDMSSVKEPFLKACDSAETVMVIGSDALKKLKAKIHYPRKQITINGLFCNE